MDDNGGDNVIDMPRSKLGIREMLGSVPGARPGKPLEQFKEGPIPASAPGKGPDGEGLDMDLPENPDALPEPGDPYKAYSRAANKPLLTVCFLLKDSAVRGFSYSNFDSIDRVPSPVAGGGPAIVMRFAGLAPSEVRMEGRNLNSLFDYAGQHRILWIRERGERRDFIEEPATVVSKISITRINEK